MECLRGQYYDQVVWYFFLIIWSKWIARWQSLLMTLYYGKSNHSHNLLLIMVQKPACTALKITNRNPSEHQQRTSVMYRKGGKSCKVVCMSTVQLCLKIYTVNGYILVNLRQELGQSEMFTWPSLWNDCKTCFCTLSSIKSEVFPHSWSNLTSYL